jgi:hypothetical protein
MCTYVGKESGAKNGHCTRTAGYLGTQEIRDIIQNNKNVKQFKADEGSNILVYDDTEWVAWMDDDNKKSCTETLKGLNFGGISDWAISFDGKGLIPPNDRLTIGDRDTFPTPQWAVEPEIMKSCQTDRREKLTEAWNEAGTLAKVMLKWTKWGWPYQEALNTYLGPAAAKWWFGPQSNPITSKRAYPSQRQLLLCRSIGCAV